MKIQLINDTFSICKVADYSQININEHFVFISTTDEENSLVCPTNKVPTQVIACEDGFKAFRIFGTLDFSLIGIIAKISNLLAKHQISVFVVSTFNTDYVFVKENHFKKTIQLLKDNGYEIEGS